MHVLVVTFTSNDLTLSHASVTNYGSHHLFTYEVSITDDTGITNFRNVLVTHSWVIFQVLL